MISWLKEYILSVISISVIGLVLDSVLPNGNVKKYGQFALSIILSIALIQPLTSFIKKDFSIEQNFSEYSVDYTSAVKSTVNSIKGFEDAEVFLTSENNKITSITVHTHRERILEDAVEDITSGYLKRILNAVYGVEINNIKILE